MIPYVICDFPFVFAFDLPVARFFAVQQHLNFRRFCISSMGSDVSTPMGRLV